MAVYRIVEFIGEGGFAFVYRAEDRNLDIDVALKVLKPSFAYDEVFEKNFRREAHRAAKFRHPNVIAIHYAGKDEEVVFFSMDLLQTGLDDVVQEGGADEETIVKVGDDVASALQFAHTHEGGLVHRDLKPDNILFDRHGNAVVTDFGIAEAATNYTQATGTTVYIGTPTYMSPEQARGRPVDARSDIYSLGATLYEMATGEAPFQGADWFELGRKHIQEPPTPPRERGAAISAGLERIILRCLEKEPDDRYQSAREIRRDLKGLTGGAEPTVVLPGSADRQEADATTPPASAPPASREQRQAPPEPARGEGRPGQAPREEGRASEGREAGTARARPGRSRGAVAAAVAVAVVVLLAGAYRLNLGGLQRAFPALATVPVVGMGPVEPSAVHPTLVGGKADVTGPIEVAFSGPLFPDSATSRHVFLVGAGADTVPVTVSLPEASRSRLVLTPEDSLAFESDYEVRIDAGLLNAAGLPVRAPEPGKLRFTTRDDVVPPALAASAPAPGARDARVNVPLTLVFNEPVDPTSVSTASVQLVEAGGDPVSVEAYPSGDTARVVPAERLAEGTSYRLVLGAAHPDSSIRDVAGNPMSVDTLAFRTATGSAAYGEGAEPTPAADRPEPAYVEIRVGPTEARRWVVVYLDGERLGSPPVGTRRVSPGSQHTVEVYGVTQITNKTLRLARETVPGTAGATRSVEVRVPEFGSVNVASVPPGVVSVDGTEIGATPLGDHPLTAGRHRIEIRPEADDRDTHGVYRGEFTLRPWEWGKGLRFELPER